MRGQIFYQHYNQGQKDNMEKFKEWAKGQTKISGMKMLYAFWWVYGAHLVALATIEMIYGNSQTGMWIITALMWFFFYAISQRMDVKFRKLYEELLDETFAAWKKQLEDSNQPVWLIWSNEHASWWAPDHKGYTSSRERAGRYRLEEAVNIVRQANIAIENSGVPNEAIVHESQKA